MKEKLDSIADVSDEINYSYIDKYVEETMKNRSCYGNGRDKGHFILSNMQKKTHIENGARNWVYNSFDYCCYTYRGLMDSVKTYEEALDIKLTSRYRHGKVLAGIILWRDMDYETQKKLISDRKGHINENGKTTTR